MTARTGVAVVEVTAQLDDFDFSTADHWEVLVLHDSVPVARVRLPSPGAVNSARLARALLWPHAERARRVSATERLLGERLGIAPRPPAPAVACSVVVCTHGRPDHLATALAALARLEPAPLEVIVVDNDPGEQPCEAEVRRHGFVYVREDRRGLDNARNTGARAARGEVTAFTDDDCVVAPGWLAPFADAFADPLVAAVTGPAFPYALDTPARVRMERQASLTRGLSRFTLDWTLISPLHAGQAGVGANMAIRSALLRAVHEPFPPELDAGSATRSGGDTYLFARLLAAGHRIAYEPRAFVFHQHRADWDAVDAAVRGYGTGLVAALVKLLVEDGELEAPRAALWLLSQYLRTQRRRLLRRADAVETRLAWGYVRGGAAGMRAWRRALRTQRAIDPLLRPAAAFPPPTARPLPVARRPVAPATLVAGAPQISVIVPTVGRPRTLARCLAALADQTLPAGAYEVIVVDDAPAPRAALAGGVAARVVRTAGRGAAGARNAGAAAARGRLLLFLDDDLVATPALLERHLEAHAHADPRTVAIGYSPPRPPRPGLAALGAALWWEDHFRALGEAREPTFTETLSGNVSLRRDAFLDDRRFATDFARLRREDWEWGYRLLEGGAQLRYAPDAVAAHEYELSAGQRIRACRAEARGDVLLSARHPLAACRLPLACHRPGRPRAPRSVVLRALGDPRCDGATELVLDVLERGRLRGAWSALYRRAQRAAYAHGLRAAGWRPGPMAAPAVLDVQLDDAAPPASSPAPSPNGAHASDDSHELLVVPWPDRWERWLEALQASPAPLLAITLPGRPAQPGWFHPLLAAFDGPRVMIAIGQLLDPRLPVEPLTLHEQRRGRIAHTPLGGPVDFIVVRRDALDVLRRATTFAAHGPMAVALACADDVLRSGGLVAHRNVQGPPGLRSSAIADAERAREKLRAWGALLGEHALAGSWPRAVALSGVYAAAAGAGAARRRTPSRVLSPMNTSRLLCAGYVRALRRRLRA